MKTLFLFATLFVSVSAQADYLDADGILRWDSDHMYAGQTRFITHHEAMRICPAGTHLPSAREWAMHAISLGARGILELKDVPVGLNPEGYTKISTIEADGSQDEFYFSHHGYVAPEGVLGIEWFWTSSLTAELASEPNVSDYAYFYETGFLDGDDAAASFRNYRNVVRCIP